MQCRPLARVMCSCHEWQGCQPSALRAFITVSLQFLRAQTCALASACLPAYPPVQLPCVAACIDACLLGCAVWLQASDRLLLITEALTSNGPSSLLAAGMGSSDPSDTAGGSCTNCHPHLHLPEHPARLPAQPHCVPACLSYLPYGCAAYLQASDRLLLITEALTSNGPSSFLAAGMGSSDPSDTAGGSGSDLHVHHVLLPAAYLAANWPLQHVAVSPCGSDIAAAGLRGLVVYNRKQERWRMFGEVMQVCADCWGSGSTCAGICSSTCFLSR